MQRQLLERTPKESKCFPGLREKVAPEPVMEAPAKKGKGKPVMAEPAPAPDAGKKKQKKKDVI